MPSIAELESLSASVQKADTVVGSRCVSSSNDYNTLLQTRFTDDVFDNRSESQSSSNGKCKPMLQTRFTDDVFEVPVGNQRAVTTSTSDIFSTSDMFHSNDSLLHEANNIRPRRVNTYPGPTEANQSAFVRTKNSSYERRFSADTAEKNIQVGASCIMEDAADARSDYSFYTRRRFNNGDTHVQRAVTVTPVIAETDLIEPEDQDFIHSVNDTIPSTLRDEISSNDFNDSFIRYGKCQSLSNIGFDENNLGLENSERLDHVNMLPPLRIPDRSERISRLRLSPLESKARPNLRSRSMTLSKLNALVSQNLHRPSLEFDNRHDDNLLVNDSVRVMNNKYSSNFSTRLPQTETTSWFRGSVDFLSLPNEFVNNFNNTAPHNSPWRNALSAPCKSDQWELLPMQNIPNPDSLILESCLSNSSKSQDFFPMQKHANRDKLIPDSCYKANNSSNSWAFPIGNWCGNNRAHQSATQSKYYDDESSLYGEDRVYSRVNQRKNYPQNDSLASVYSNDMSIHSNPLVSLDPVEDCDQTTPFQIDDSNDRMKFQIEDSNDRMKAAEDHIENLSGSMKNKLPVLGANCMWYL